MKRVIALGVLTLALAGCTPFTFPVQISHPVVPGQGCHAAPGFACPGVK